MYLSPSLNKHLYRQTKQGRLFMSKSLLTGSFLLSLPSLLIYSSPFSNFNCDLVKEGTGRFSGTMIQYEHFNSIVNANSYSI